MVAWGWQIDAAVDSGFTGSHAEPWVHARGRHPLSPGKGLYHRTRSSLLHWCITQAAHGLGRPPPLLLGSQTPGGGQVLPPTPTPTPGGPCSPSPRDTDIPASDLSAPDLITRKLLCFIANGIRNASTIFHATACAWARCGGFPPCPHPARLPGS